MNIVIITQARLGSTRLPAKVLATVDNRPLLALHLHRLKQVRKATQIAVATTFEPEVEPIKKISEDEGVFCFQGSTEDLLDRYTKAAQAVDADVIVRVTSDCPLIDPHLVDCIIGYFERHTPDYCSNTLFDLFPDGQDIEVFSRQSVERAWKEANLPSDREHVTPYIKRNSDINGGSLFKALSHDEGKGFHDIRMTVDENSDLEAIRKLVSRLGPDAGWQDYAKYISNNPSEFQNQKILRNEGYINSIKKDKLDG